MRVGEDEKVVLGGELHDCALGAREGLEGVLGGAHKRRRLALLRPQGLRSELPHPLRRGQDPHVAPQPRGVDEVGEAQRTCPAALEQVELLRRW